MPRQPAERGAVGLPLFAGRLSLDTNTRLRGPQAMKTYRQMLLDEPACAALKTAILTLFRTDMQVQPGGNTDADKRAAEFLEQCLDDMRESLPTTLRQMAGALDYGFGIHELVYKRRGSGPGSRYDDGRVGWAAWALRRQETLERWETDKNGRVIAFTQRPAPDYKLRTIPFTKAIHVLADDTEGSPEGRSVYRGMYRYWYMVTQFELLMGISLERFGTGLPVFKRLDGVTLTEAQEDTLASIAEGLRQNEFAYLILPPGIDFTFAPSPGLNAATYLATIQRFRVWMLATALAEFIALGTGETGSWALGKSKIDLFLRALTGFQDRLTDAINRQAIARLFRMNDFGPLTDLPRVTLPAVREYDLQGLAQFAQVLEGIGAFHPTVEDEELFRNISDLPDLDRATLEELHMQQTEGGLMCPECGAMNAADATTCATCGAALVEEEEGDVETGEDEDEEAMEEGEDEDA